MHFGIWVFRGGLDFASALLGFLRVCQRLDYLEGFIFLALFGCFLFIIWVFLVLFFYLIVN